MSDECVAGGRSDCRRTKEISGFDITRKESLNRSEIRGEKSKISMTLGTR